MKPLAIPPGPHSPRLAVLAVVTRADPAGARVLLVRRANPPQAGFWGFPGGKVEWGEDLGQAAIRELKEETGVDGANPVVFNAIDLIETDPAAAGRPAAPAHHDLMIAVHLEWRAGNPAAGDDALEACWVAPAALPRPLCADVARVVAEALARRR